MEATLLVPYSYSDPEHDFDCGDEIIAIQKEKWKKSMDEYNRKMVDTYQKYKPMINRNMGRIGQNIAINNEGEKENNTYKQQNVYMTETLAFVRNMYNKDIDIDTLIDYYKTGEMFIIDLQLPVYEKNDELESEIKAWKRETMKINMAPDLTDEQRIMGYTKRDLKLQFKDSKSSALLKNAKLVDIVNNHTFAFLVEEIIFLTQ